MKCPKCWQRYSGSHTCASERLLALVGKRFACDFEVLSIGPGPQALLLMRGERYLLSTDELLTIIERGLVAEVPPRH